MGSWFPLLASDLTIGRVTILDKYQLSSVFGEIDVHVCLSYLAGGNGKIKLKGRYELVEDRFHPTAPPVR